MLNRVPGPWGWCVGGEYREHGALTSAARSQREALGGDDDGETRRCNRSRACLPASLPVAAAELLLALVAATRGNGKQGTGDGELGFPFPRVPVRESLCRPGGWKLDRETGGRKL